MRCLWCHKDVAAGWALCPDCGSTLEAGPAGDGIVPVYRPAGEKPFDPFVIAMRAPFGIDESLSALFGGWH